jgi:hypothetical protein
MLAIAIPVKPFPLPFSTDTTTTNLSNLPAFLFMCINIGCRLVDLFRANHKRNLSLVHSSLNHHSYFAYFLHTTY